MFFILFESAREYLFNGTPPFRKLQVGDWFVKFGQKLELMCFKNSVHLGAEKYLHVWNAGAKYFCCAGQWGKKKLGGKDLVVLSINLSQALNVINML